MRGGILTASANEATRDEIRNARVGGEFPRCISKLLKGEVGARIFTRRKKTTEIDHGRKKEEL